MPRPGWRRSIVWCALVLTTLIALIAPLAASSDAARAQDDAPPLPLAAPGEHPRLLITREYVDRTLRPRTAENRPAWIALLAYASSDVPEADAEAHPDGAIRALAVVWLITGEADYAARARLLLDALAERVASALAEGMLSVAFFNNVSALAVGYDWLYEALDGDQRAALEQTLSAAAKRLRDPEFDRDGLLWDGDQPRAFTSASARGLWALTASALALRGERPEADGLIASARDLFTGAVLPALDQQTGGAWAEGPFHGFYAGWALAQTALAWWTAAGENYFDDTTWWHDRLAYDLFQWQPGSAPLGDGSGLALHRYPAIIGDTPRYHPAAFYGRAQDTLLRAVFAGFEHAHWMDWFLTQPPSAVPGWLAVEEFLWRDEAYGGLPPAPRTWIAPYNGHVFMRSNWFGDGLALDNSAVAVTFTAGDRLSAAQFYDQGSFTISRGADDLAVRSGLSTDGGDSDHDANWTARTLAANTILICNLTETFDNIRPNAERAVWLNDCGQRSTAPYPSGPGNLETLIANWQAYDTGSLVRSSEIGEATYLRADITGAYNSTFYATPDNAPKVRLALRELVYWRPDLVIVSDRVVTTDLAYSPLTVVHFEAEPQPDGLYYRVQHGNSALYLQNLLPNSRVSLARGFEVAGQPVNQAFGAPARNATEPRAPGAFRLDVMPGAPQLDNWFLTALVAQAADAPAPSEGVLVLGERVRGVALGTRQVLFAVSAGDGASLSEAAFPIAPGIEHTLVTGLLPGASYRVTLEGSATRTLTADAGGMLLLANVLPGQVRLALE
ncbi:MAG: hypothetical protein IT325_13295 [Anaerolineae bacterium]|nr:hypothetical protein [Anaerolineae bacterium]